MSEEPRISRVDAASATIPMSRSFPATYTDEFLTEHVFVRVEADDGTVGHGEGPILSWFTGETAASAEALAETYYADRLTGTPLPEASALLTNGGALPGNPATKTALEMAVLDCLARRRDLPLHVLLGDRLRDAVPVVHAVGAVDAGRAAESAAERLAAGYDTFKLKVTGDAPPDRDRVAAVAAELDGTGASLRIDSNTAWTDYRGAVAAFDRLASVVRESVDEVWRDVRA